MKMNWIIRKSCLEESEEIVRLHDEANKAVFGVSDNHNSLWDGDLQSWWRWWNFENPTGRHRSVVVDNGGKIIGHHAVIYTWMNISGKKRLGCYGWGACTHPDYMRQGILRSLLENQFEHLKVDDVIALYGVTTGVNRKLYLKNGFYDLELMNRLVKVLDPAMLMKGKTHSVFLSRILGYILGPAFGLFSIRDKVKRHRSPGKVIQIDHFDERFDRLWEKNKKEIGISIWKDAEYLNWRFVARPNAKYEIYALENKKKIICYAVTRYVEGKYKVGYVVDWMCLPGHNASFSVLMDHILAKMKASGATLALCNIYRHDPLYKTLTRKGFFNRPKSGVWNAVDIEDTYKWPLDEKNVTNWLLTPGDGDII